MKYLLPDRYEKLQNSKVDVDEIIVPIKAAIQKIEEIVDYMESSLGGFFLVLKGRSGEGKTTFLNTLNLHFKSIEIISIDESKNVKSELESLSNTKKELRILVLEGRESFGETKHSAIESELHAINKFIRSQSGINTIVVWPINDDDMLDSEMLGAAKKIGGTSLLSKDNILEFSGPPREKFIKILKDTFRVLNHDNDIVEFGITDKIAENILKDVDTIGEYLQKISRLIQEYKKQLKESKDRFDLENVWIVVVAGNDPYQEIRALTKGKKSLIDHDRVLYSTDSNTAKNLRDKNLFPLLLHELNARLIMIPAQIAIDIMKASSNDKLIDLLKENEIKPKNTSIDLSNSMLGHSLSDIKMSKKYTTPDCNFSEFKKITRIASSNDVILNREIGEVLVKNGLIYKYETESKFTGLENRRTDLLCNLEGQYVRLEFMWKESASESEIADYTVKKLNAYGTAIDIL